MAAMYRMNSALAFLGLFLVTVSLPAQTGSLLVSAKIRSTSAWKSYPTRVVSDLPANVVNQPAANLSQFGGLLSCRLNITGFFYATNFNGRWWLVDPEGCLFLDKGVSDVSIVRGPTSRDVLKQTFGNETN